VRHDTTTTATDLLVGWLMGLDHIVVQLQLGQLAIEFAMGGQLHHGQMRHLPRIGDQLCAHLAMQ
jgi:hypothetical protein